MTERDYSSFMSSGLPCLSCIGPMDTWCGYVGVNKGHPLYEINYNDIECDTYEDYEIRVHGGLTFSNYIHNISVASIDNPELIWWLGFDCPYPGDLIPGLTSTRRGNIYRNEDYVRNQCVDLAAQLAFNRVGEVKEHILVPIGRRLIDVG